MTSGAVDPTDLSDDALAALFTRAHRSRYRFCAAHGRWYVYRAGVFEMDTKAAILDVVRETVREATENAGLSLHSPRSEKARSARTIGAVERILRSDPVHAISAADFDLDPWALNTKGGVVDLRTGQTRPASERIVHTKITNGAPVGSCPRWLQFLDEATAGDLELQSYLQRLAGYALTGSVREHCLVFVVGQAGTGKSRLVEALTFALGGYALTSPMETFADRGHDGHPTEIARLQGARLVTASETAANRSWNAGRIKWLTGGDRLIGRFMRADFVEFDPQFKLLLVGNHRPRLHGADDGVRRRLHVVEFNQKPVRPDEGLSERLRLEASGILAWAVEGCLAWQEGGLRPPAAVTAAAESYLESEDVVGQWLVERTERTVSTFVPSVRLFADWKQWAESRGEPARSVRYLSEALMQKGIRQARSSKERGFVGLQLLPESFGGFEV